MVTKYGAKQIIINSKIYFKARDVMFYYVIDNRTAKISVCDEIKKISSDEYIRPLKKKDGYLITALGLKQWIMNSPIRFTLKEKQTHVNSLVDNGFLSESERFFYSSTKESSFYSNIYDFFEHSCVDLKIKKQVSVNEFIVDLVINNNIAIEFDEFNHRGYNAQMEKKRELSIKSNGYELLRFNDSQSFGEIIGIIIKNLIIRDLI